jgi:hypothetical protein
MTLRRIRHGGRSAKHMTDDDKMLDKEAARLTQNILRGAAYSSGITDLIHMVCRRILSNHEPGDRPTLYKELYDELQTAFGNIEVPSLEDMLQLAKHKGE